MLSQAPARQTGSAIATTAARFGLTESRLGLLPAVISPYVIEAIGSRQSRRWFATGKINLFGSWALTKGHFWPMLGAYLLAFILAIIAYMAVFAILMLVMVAVGGGFSAMGAIISPDMSSLKAFFTPTMLIYELIAAVPAPFLLLIMLCPATDIYRSLTGGSPAA